MFQRDKYPQNWEAISKRIRIERAGGKCEWCGAPDGLYIKRRRDNPAQWQLSPRGKRFGGNAEWYKSVKVVLTVHHIGIDKPDGTPGDSHDKMDCRDENLAALCQRCHLRADIKVHMENAKRTRAEKQRRAAKNAGQLELF